MNPEDYRWGVKVTAPPLHVRPVKMGAAQEWARTMLPWWHAFTLKALHMEWPRNEAELMEAITLCQRWCDRENRLEDEQRKLVSLYVEARGG